jgi:hypothetical protein
LVEFTQSRQLAQKSDVKLLPCESGFERVSESNRPLRNRRPGASNGRMIRTPYTEEPFTMAAKKTAKKSTKKKAAKKSAKKKR